MAAPELSASTVRYLFASTWAPPDDSAWAMQIPGGRSPGIETAANLLEIAVWSLREQGLADVTQIRPVERKAVTVMGGKSFSRFTALGSARKRPGLEGALLETWREGHGQQGLRGIDEALGKLLSGDDEDGLRGTILALDLNSKAPWNTVASYCAGEAREARVLEIEGKRPGRPVIADPDAVEALQERDADIVAARTAYRESEPELDAAVIADCMASVHWAHTGSPD